MAASHFVKAQIAVKISKYHKFLSMLDTLNMYETASR
jgi:hypothetical protein